MNLNKQFGCVVFGGSLVEQVVQIPRLPHHQQDNVPLSRMEILPGGSGANVAVYLARLGVPTRLLDRWGNDWEADLLETTYHREGVEIHFCRRHQELTTPFMIILTLPDNDWTGITRIPEEAQLKPGDFPLESILSGKFIHFHGFSLSTKSGQAGVDWALKAAKLDGIQISLDACTPVAREFPEIIRRLVPFCRLFFANVVEALALTNKSDLVSAALDLLSLGTEAVIIKAGEEGCYFIERGQRQVQHCPAIPTQITDTIGAGDAVVAGVIAGLIQEFNMKDSIRLGTASAALTCQGVGAQSRGFSLIEACQLAGLSIKSEFKEEPTDG